MKRNNYWILTLLATAGASACGKGAAVDAPRQIVADISISVANQSDIARSIVLEAQSGAYDLGMVAPHETKTFSVPSGAGKPGGHLQLEARRSLGPVSRSADFRLNPGDRFVWVVNRDTR